MKKIISYTFYILGVIAAIYGTYGFLRNFITDFGIDRVLLAPIILPLYNIPAIILFLIGRKLRDKSE